MATYTAASGGGNWNAVATWEEGGGYPGSGDNAVLDSGSGNVTVNVASACKDLTCTGYTGTLTLSANLTIYGNLAFSSGMTFTHNDKVVKFAATSSGKTITSGGKTWCEVVFDGSGGEWTLQDDMVGGVDPNDFICTTGTLNLNGKKLESDWNAPAMTAGFTLNIGTGQVRSYHGWTIGSGVIVTISTGTIHTGGINMSGTLTCTGAATIDMYRGSTVTFGSGFTAGSSTVVIWQSATLIAAANLYNLQVGSEDYWAVSTVTLGSDVTVENNVLIREAYGGYDATLALSTYTLKVGGDFTNDATFTAGTGTVEFITDTKTSTVKGSTATTFYVLKCQAGGKTVKFKASQTVTVTTFDFDGGSGDLIVLDTDTGSGTWTLSDSTGTNTVEYCDIHRSTATGGATWEALTSAGNVDGGGNTGWTFSGGGTPVEVLADGLRLVTAEGSALADSRRLLTVEASGLSDSLRYVQADATALPDALRHIAVDASALPDSTRFVQADASALPDALRHVSSSSTALPDTRRQTVATASALADALRIVVTGMYAYVRADTLRIVTSSTSALSDVTRRLANSLSVATDSRRLVSLSASAAADVKRLVEKTVSVLADLRRVVITGLGLVVRVKLAGIWTTCASMVKDVTFKPVALLRKRRGRWGSS